MLRPSDLWVRLALVPVVVFVAMSANTGHLVDFWHHLARGRIIVETGELLNQDVFTFTVPGERFQDVNWGTQVGYYALFRVGGLDLVRVANAAVLAVALGWLVVLCRRLSGSTVAAMTVGILTFLGLWQVLSIRPQTLSFLFFIALLDVLERSERRPSLLVIPPFVMILWVNAHGAFPAGLLLVGGWLGGTILQEVWRWRQHRSLGAQLIVPLWEKTRLLTGCLLLCGLATLVNPYAGSVYTYVGQTSGRAVARRIDEWLPPSLDQMIGAAFFVSIGLVTVLGVLAWRGERRGVSPPVQEPAPNHNPVVTGPDLVLCAGFFILACGSIRMVAWWLVVLAPVLAKLLARLLPPTDPESERTPSRGAALSFWGLLAVAGMSFPGLSDYNPLLAFREKDRLVTDLDAAVQATVERAAQPGPQIGAPSNVFARFEWSEYLTWSAWPRCRVFMDGRIEIYPDEVWKAYSEITTGGKDWESLVRKYGVDVLIVDRDYHERTGLLGRIREAGWHEAFRTDLLAAYVVPK